MMTIYFIKFESLEYSKSFMSKFLTNDILYIIIQQNVFWKKKIEKKTMKFNEIFNVLVIFCYTFQLLFTRFFF